MDNLITKVDFKNPYLVFGGADNSENEIYLNELIAEYQEIILKRILGIRLYNEMDANITDLFWVNFINGVSYIENDVTYVYGGIKEVIARMVYYHWNIMVSNSLIPNGAIVLDFKEGHKEVPISKMVKQFNIAVDLISNNINYDATVYHFLITQYAGDLLEFGTFEKVNSFGL